MRLIIFTLMVMNVIVEGEVCFDESTGSISVTLALAPDVHYEYVKWDLRWLGCDWSNTGRILKDRMAVATGPGCCSNGVVYVIGPRGVGRLNCPFAFLQERRILCASGLVSCTFPLTLSKHGNYFYVHGTITCICVADYTEVTDVWREDFEANFTDAQVESLFVLE
jgi:hypothetical protein